MYQPRLRDDQIRKIDRVAQVRQQHMTDVLRHAVDHFLDTCRDEWADPEPTPYEKRKAEAIRKLTSAPLVT
jgi:hypothetical protein